MLHHAVVVVAGTYGKTEFTFEGRQPFISPDKEKAKEHQAAMQKMWPKERYQIVSFDVKVNV